uniref:HTH CENPB-type domain-containing protein n=1 Tax=Panagrellus redivivus TaxID=6233 RepID=A0A7E4W7L6_PANRE
MTEFAEPIEIISHPLRRPPSLMNSQFYAAAWPWLAPFYSAATLSPALYPHQYASPVPLSLDDYVQPLDLTLPSPLPIISEAPEVLPTPPPPQRSTVIQYSTTTLPTCSQPEISLEISHLDKKSPSIASSSAVSSSETSPNRMSYPREFKLMVIDYYYANGHNKYRTCKEFQITKSMLNGWLTKADKIRQSRPGALKSGRSGRKPQFPVIEKQLFEVYQDRIAQGEKVSNRWLRESARTLALKQCSSTELSGMCQFSERWLSNFKRRYGIGSGKPVASDSSTASGDDYSLRAVASDDEDNDDESCCSESEGSTSALMAQAVLHHEDGLLPIQVFYEKFPWLCRKSGTDVPENVSTSTASENPGTRGRRILLPTVEKRLYELVQMRDPTEKLTNKWLQEQARALASELAPEIGAACSEHWLHNFKKRYGLINSMPTNNSQKASPSVSS